MKSSTIFRNRQKNRQQSLSNTDVGDRLPKMSPTCWIYSMPVIFDWNSSFLFSSWTEIPKPKKYTFNIKSELLINFVSLIIVFTFFYSNYFQNDFEFEINESPILDNWINLSDICPNYSNPVYKPDLARFDSGKPTFNRIDRLPSVWRDGSTGKANIINKYDQLKSQPTFLLEDLSI